MKKTTKIIAISIPGSVIAGVILNIFSDLTISTIVILTLSVLILLLLYFLLYYKPDSDGAVIGINHIHTNHKPSITDIVENANSSFFFMGISAKRTNSSPELQNKIIEIGQKKGEIRFLLLNPESENLKKRAYDEKDEFSSWQSEINATIDRLKSFEIKHKIKIQIRLYDEYPIWRMNIVNSNKIYAHYFLINKQGSQSPQIEITENNSSIFWPLFNTYNELWNKSKIV